MTEKESKSKVVDAQTHRVLLAQNQLKSELVQREDSPDSLDGQVHQREQQTQQANVTTQLRRSQTCKFNRNDNKNDYKKDNKTHSEMSQLNANALS